MDQPFSWRSDGGNIASVIGLLLTIAGFLVTWWNQRRLRRETSAAQQQAIKIISGFTDHLALVTFTALSVLAQELRQTLRAKQWDRAIDKAEQLRNQLSRAVPTAQLTEEERRFVVESIDNAQLIVDQAERRQRKRPDEPIENQAARTLDTLIVTLSKIDGRLRYAQLEVQDGKPEIQ